MLHSKSLASFALLALASASPLPSDNESGLVSRQLGGGCKAVTVIFARGTTELGSLGSVAGPPFQMALSAKMPGQVDFQGVPAPAYPADVPGYLAGGSATGAAKMAEMVKQVASSCPQTKIIMSGYRWVAELHESLFIANKVKTAKEGSLSIRLESRLAKLPPGWQVLSSSVTLTTRSLLPTSRT